MRTRPGWDPTALSQGPWDCGAAVGSGSPGSPCSLSVSISPLDLCTHSLSFLLNQLRVGSQGCGWASLLAQLVRNLPAMGEARVPSQDREDPLEKGKATYSSILAWRIPWTGEPGGLSSMGLQSWTQLSDWHTHTGLWVPAGLFFCRRCLLSRAGSGQSCARSPLLLMVSNASSRCSVPFTCPSLFPFRNHRWTEEILP